MGKLAHRRGVARLLPVPSHVLKSSSKYGNMVLWPGPVTVQMFGVRRSPNTRKWPRSWPVWRRRVFSKVWSVCAEIGDVGYCYELSRILDGRRFFVIKHTLFLELLLRLMLGPGPGSSTGRRLSIVKSFRSALPFNILLIPCWESTLQKPIEPDYQSPLPGRSLDKLHSEIHVWHSSLSFCNNALLSIYEPFLFVSGHYARPAG